MIPSPLSHLKLVVPLLEYAIVQRKALDTTGCGKCRNESHYDRCTIESENGSGRAITILLLIGRLLWFYCERNAKIDESEGVGSLYADPRGIRSNSTPSSSTSWSWKGSCAKRNFLIQIFSREQKVHCAYCFVSGIYAFLLFQLVEAANFFALTVSNTMEWKTQRGYLLSLHGDFGWL